MRGQWPCVDIQRDGAEKSLIGATWGGGSCWRGPFEQLVTEGGYRKELNKWIKLLMTLDTLTAPCNEQGSGSSLVLHRENWCRGGGRNRPTTTTTAIPSALSLFLVRSLSEEQGRHLSLELRAKANVFTGYHRTNLLFIHLGLRMTRVNCDLVIL